MIVVEQLTKRFGSKLAVDNLSFEVRAGAVTGFVGPNGSGKSTTMRCMLDLARPTAGRASIDGMAYRKHRQPLHVAGAVLDAKSFHPGRTAANHLAVQAVANRIPRARVGEVLELVGLTQMAKRRAGSFSLGMGQRLGIAAALLGKPKALILDEPMNGLDPDGVSWLRELMRHLASEGTAVLVSSHLLSEVALVCDELVVIGQGKVLANESMQSFMDRNAQQWVHVTVTDPELLAQLVVGEGGMVHARDGHSLEVRGMARERVGELAFRNNLMVTELTSQSQSLEQVFLDLTGGSVEFRSGGTFGGGA